MSSHRKVLLPEIWTCILSYIPTDVWRPLADVCGPAREAANDLLRKLQRRYVARWRKNMTFVNRLGPTISLAAVQRGRRFQERCTFEPRTWQRHQARIRCVWDWISVRYYKRSRGYWAAYSPGDLPGNIVDALYVRGKNITKVELLVGGWLLWTSHRVGANDHVCTYFPFILPLPSAFSCDIELRMYADTVSEVQFKCGFLETEQRRKNVYEDVKIFLTSDGMAGVKIGAGVQMYQRQYQIS